MYAAYEHMLQVHPCSSSDADRNAIKPEIDEECPNVKCIDCGAALKGSAQFQIHLWRHYNKYEPSKRGRQRISSR